jgi:hypothetical protein
MARSHDEVLRDLHRSLNERWRPEDVAAAILELLRDDALSAGGRTLLGNKLRIGRRGASDGS